VLRVALMYRLFFNNPEETKRERQAQQYARVGLTGYEIACNAPELSLFRCAKRLYDHGPARAGLRVIGSSE